MRARPPSPGGGGSARAACRGGVMPSKPMQQFRRQTAKHLRANTTGAEQRLWKMLRSLPLSGSHFRRQVPIGPYVADFACMTSRLIIEVDGSQHAQPNRAAHDKSRTEWLEREGYRVLRFWNSDLENREAVLSSIYEALHGSIDAEALHLKLKRRSKIAISHPTPARVARRPSPSRGG